MESQYTRKSKRNRKIPRAKDVMASNFNQPLIEKTKPNDSDSDSSSDEDEDDAEFLGKPQNLQPSENSENNSNLAQEPLLGKRAAEPQESSDEDSESESEVSDSEDDEEAILMEYERLKKEREEKEKKEIEEKMDQMGVGEGYSLKKKWFQETPFQNQHVREEKEKKEFCNDTVRSKFHKKILHKFIQN